MLFRSVRAPIFEEKVVDHILTQVKIIEKSVSKESLLNEDDEDDAAPAAEKPKKAPAKKAKKADAMASDAMAAPKQ